MRFSIEKIDAPRARALLTKNVKNRPLNQRTVARYAADMRRGAWATTGDTIKIGRSGLVIDGQHRLAAIVEADASVTIAIAYDVPDESFDSIDIGRARKGSDALSIIGKHNQTTLAAAARLAFFDERGMLDIGNKWLSPIAKLTPTNRDIVATVDAYPDLAECADDVRGVYRHAGALLAYGLGAFLLFKFRRLSEADADRFFSSLHDGAGLSPGDPLLLLRERLIRNRSEKRKLEPREIYAITVKVWNATRQGRPMSPAAIRLRTGENAESLPVPI
jgi:hypothetical protein